MANEEQLAILQEGVEVWNHWRAENRNVKIDLSQAYLPHAHLVGANLTFASLGKADLRVANLRRADLFQADLVGANLGEAYLVGANLQGGTLTGANLRSADLRDANLTGASLNLKTILVEATLTEANLSYADLTDADLRQAILCRANLSRADLTNAHLRAADLGRADLSRAVVELADLTNAVLDRSNLNGTNLTGANLFGASLVGADLRQANLYGANLMLADLSSSDLTGANLATATLVSTKIEKAKASGSWVYAANVWDLEGEFEEQKDLVVTRMGQPIVTVDNIKVAQFVYLILNNGAIRDVINTLTSKTVLILGRFALPERKAILDALRNKIREYNLLPIVFDFDRPTDKDFTETIKTLAGLSYFVIADVTNPKSSPLELQATVPNYQVPFVPIIQEGEKPFAMMVDLQKKYPWVLNTLSYSSIETLMKALKPAIIDPAIQMHNELRLIKAREPEIRSADDFIDDK